MTYRLESDPEIKECGSVVEYTVRAVLNTLAFTDYVFIDHAARRFLYQHHFGPQSYIIHPTWEIVTPTIS
jgi:hypothetical protein